MRKEIYDSIVSKLAMVVPLFSKAMVDIGVEKRGFTVESISPVEFKELVERDIIPRISRHIGREAKLYIESAAVICLDSNDSIVFSNFFLEKILGELSFDLSKLFKLGIIKHFNDISEVEVKEFFLENIGRHLNITFVPICDHSGRKIYSLFVIQDITLKKYIEMEVGNFAEKVKRLNSFLEKEIKDHLLSAEALSKSEERFKQISHSMSEWIWEVDKDNKFQYVSEKVEDILGYNPKELMGISPAEIVPKEEVERLSGVIKNTVSEKKPIVDLESCGLSKNGKKVSLLINGLPMLDADRGFIGYRGIARDITARKKEKEEVDKMQHQLMQSAKLASIGELASSVAHEINNPLSILMGNLDQFIIILEQNKISKEPFERFIEAQRSSIERMMGIVNGLRTHVRASDNKKEPMNVHDAIINTVRLLQGIYKSSGIEIVEDLNAPDSVINGNIGRFQQLLVNLLNNSKDAIEETKDQRQGMIRISTYSQNGKFFVAVWDNGCGIEKDEIPRIFESFYTTKPVGKGTGLGMSIIQNILSNFRGDIKVDSTINIGTKMTMSFPLLMTKQAILQNNREAVVYNKLFGNVLVVDDEQEIREIMVFNLNKFGLKVETAKDGNDALELLRKQKYDLLITDNKMPGMGGTSLIFEIQKLQLQDMQLKDMKVLVATGSINVEQKISGIDGLILKPFTKEDLYIAISEMLKK